MTLRNTSSSPTNKLIHEYTSGSDRQYDQKLLLYDIKGSAAHATMLKAIGVYTKEEEQLIQGGLTTLSGLINSGDFRINPDQEDSHTAIEERLIQNHGELGKKIHTGRSRNDQALVTMRLYMKQMHKKTKAHLTRLIEQGKIKERNTKQLPMPGYTHMQKAMPTTVSTRIGSYNDALADISEHSQLENILDQNPLGSVAGYGDAGFGIQRNMTTTLLDFKKTQKNPMHCAMSRGMVEYYLVQHLSNIHIILGKLATDILLFTTSEFDFMSLPDEYTTGSSVMPQKKNYDLLEILRANTSLMIGYQQQLATVISNLGSGYHRDYQCTKKACIDSIELTNNSIQIMTHVLQDLVFHKQNLLAACTPELYATKQAYELVKKGIPFRDAYHQIRNLYS